MTDKKNSKIIRLVLWSEEEKIKEGEVLSINSTSLEESSSTKTGEFFLKKNGGQPDP